MHRVPWLCLAGNGFREKASGRTPCASGCCSCRMSNTVFLEPSGRLCKEMISPDEELDSKRTAAFVFFASSGGRKSALTPQRCHRLLVCSAGCVAEPFLPGQEHCCRRLSRIRVAASDRRCGLLTWSWRASIEVEE